MRSVSSPPIRWSLTFVSAALIGALGISVSMVSEWTGLLITLVGGAMVVTLAMRSSDLGLNRGAVLGMVGGLGLWLVVAPAF